MHLPIFHEEEECTFQSSMRRRSAPSNLPRGGVHLPIFNVEEECTLQPSSWRRNAPSNLPRGGVVHLTTFHVEFELTPRTLVLRGSLCTSSLWRTFHVELTHPEMVKPLLTIWRDGSKMYSLTFDEEPACILNLVYEVQCNYFSTFSVEEFDFLNFSHEGIVHSLTFSVDM